MGSERHAQLAHQIRPLSFASTCTARSRDEFLSEFAGTPFLLVQLDDDWSELAASLERASTSPVSRLKPTYDGIGFSTVMHSAADEPASRAHGRFGPTTLQTLLVRNCHFVVPLRKRATERAFVEHISVGRARNSDVVLRHDSVSKFHAWFECDESGMFYVADAKSKNGTKVNGEGVSGQPMTPLAPGDEIRFGRVTSVLCDPETLWTVIAGG